MNIKTDVDVTPESLNKHRSFWTIARIAREGTEEQRDTVLSWAYSNCSHDSYSILCWAAERPWLITD